MTERLTDEQLREWRDGRIDLYAAQCSVQRGLLALRARGPAQPGQRWSSGVRSYARSAKTRKNVAPKPLKTLKGKKGLTLAVEYVKPKAFVRRWAKLFMKTLPPSRTRLNDRQA